MRLARGAAWGVRFIHSVALRPVEEFYTFDGRTITLRSTRFDMGGAGLPSELYGHQKLTVTADGHYVIDGFDQPMESVTYRAGQVVADHHFLTGARCLSFTRWTAPGKPLTFATARRPRLWWFFHHL